MDTSIIISGYGGQGLLFAGSLLCHAAMIEGKQTTWIPSYGAEMRGGAANYRADRLQRFAIWPEIRS